MSEPFPLLNLSPELVGEIFCHCLPERASFSSSEAPLLLTQVCSSWRTIAVGTPRLWSSLYVPNWQYLPPDVGSLVRLWLERSGQTKLSVDITLFDQDIQVFPSDEETIKLRLILCETLLSLASHRQRIRRIKCVFPEELIPLVGVEHMASANSMFLCGTLTDPESALRLTPSDETEPVLMPLIDIGPQRESLNMLCLYGLPVDLAAIRQHKQLTHLELIDLHSSGALCQRTVLDLLQNLKNLKSAVLDMTILDRPALSPPHERVVIENLQILFITWAFPADISTLIDSICTPNLEKFCLRGTPLVANDQPWPNLSRFLKASGAPIKRISFGDFGSLDFQLLDCLKQCEQVEQMTINHCVLTDSNFEELAQKDPKRSLVPKLKIFTMGVCEGFAADSLLRFARSRSEEGNDGISKLAELNVYYCIGVTEDTKETLVSYDIDVMVEAMDPEVSTPYARVVETHHELVALLFQS